MACSTLRAVPPPPSDVAPPTSGGRILVIEDDDGLRLAYARVLRRASFEVVEARSRRHASELLNEVAVDLVMSDIRLPDGNGLEVLRHVRELDADLPVVLMTGGADISTAVDAVENGALHFLQKPIDKDVLCAVAEDGVRTRQRNARRQRAVAFYEMHESATASRRLLGEQVSCAVRDIHMLYQPIVRYSAREIVAFEALVRSKVDAFASPPLLFEAAAQTGNLMDLGRAIRRDVALSVDDAPLNARVFVNLHPRDLLDDDLYDAAAPLSRVARKVTLEITEHASIDGIEALHERTERLHEMGFQIAIDDLGAGHSSLAALALLRPDVVKLDMSFVRGVDRDRTRQKLVRTMARLCDDLGVAFVTEGIESHEELETLVGLGCDVFQGWHFAMPGAPFPGVDWAG